jgi:hypothetical protein
LTLHPLPLQTPGYRGRLPWANLPKQKEPPHRGDIGWGRFLLRQFVLYPTACDLKYKLRDNILASLSGNTESIFLNDKSFGKPCLKDLSLTSLPGDSTKTLFPFSLIVSGKLSGDEASCKFTCCQVTFWKETSFKHVYFSDRYYKPSQQSETIVIYFVQAIRHVSHTWLP